MDITGNNIWKISISTALAWVILTVVFLILAAISFTVTTEDAYISFRYAENIADGYGLVFNRDGEVVEGYSNPTWVLLLSIFNKFGLGTIVAGRCLGLVFGSLTLLELILLFRLLYPTGIDRGTMAAVVLATAPYYLFWSQTGLENGLFIYLLVLGLRLAMIEDLKPAAFPYSSVAYLLLAVTRPEGIMYFGIIGAWKIVKLAGKYDKNSINRLLLWALLVIIPFALFLIWRYTTFGALVPNTFFAKVNNGIRWNLKVGTRYLLGFLTHALWAPLLVPIVAALITRTTKISQLSDISTEAPEKRLLLAVLMQAAMLVIFILYVGGDIHPNDRFGVPLLVFSSIATFVLLGRFGGKAWWRRISFGVCVLFVLLNLGYSFPPAYGISPPIHRPPNFLAANLAGLISGRKTINEIYNRFTNPPVDALESVGRDLNSNPDINGLLAAEQCGKIPYFYDQPVLDLLGLNDPDIAQLVHSISSWDAYAEEVLSNLPETFVMVYTNRRFVSRYYIENTVMSLPFRMRYRLDALYHVDYFFTDNSGLEHTFALELVRYRPAQPGSLVPLTDEELAWCSEHDPVADNPEALGDEVEEFRLVNEGDPSKVINFSVYLN